MEWEEVGRTNKENNFGSEIGLQRQSVQHPNCSRPIGRGDGLRMETSCQ